MGLPSLIDSVAQSGRQAEKRMKAGRDSLQTFAVHHDGAVRERILSKSRTNQRTLIARVVEDRSNFLSKVREFIGLSDNIDFVLIIICYCAVSPGPAFGR